MAFDEVGTLYLACFDGGKVAMFDPSGGAIDEFRIAGGNVTNVAFGGSDRARWSLLTSGLHRFTLPASRCRGCRSMVVMEDGVMGSDRKLASGTSEPV